MTDRHLNIFYSYNSDNELIENNMTRAFIVTLKFLAPSTRTRFLVVLLGSRKKDVVELDLQNMEFALQGNIDVDLNLIRKCKHKYILAITGDGLLHGSEKIDNESSSSHTISGEQIRPDGWMFNSKKPQQYFFLIEAKTVDNVLGAEQIMSYGKHYFGYRSYHELRDSLICITWYDIVDECSTFCKNDVSLNQQERTILGDFVKFLNYCRVIPFSGWNMSDIPAHPNYKFSLDSDFGFERIPNLPDYKFQPTTDLGLDKIPGPPCYFENKKQRI